MCRDFDKQIWKGLPKNIHRNYLWRWTLSIFCFLKLLCGTSELSISAQFTEYFCHCILKSGLLRAHVLQYLLRQLCSAPCVRRCWALSQHQQVPSVPMELRRSDHVTSYQDCWKHVTNCWNSPCALKKAKPCGRPAEIEPSAPFSYPNCVSSNTGWTNEFLQKLDRS